MADPNIREQVMEILSDPMNLPPDFWAYSTQSWLKDAPVFPIGQVFGFTQFVAQPATAIPTSETTTSTSYTDLATVGPSLTGLADGKYLVLFGFTGSCSDQSTLMSISVNGAAVAANDPDAAITPAAASNASVMSWKTITLANNGSNTITCKYRVNNGTATPGTFFYRRLLALRYANN